MILSSRPLRFLAGTLGSWIVVRAILLWPAGPVTPAALIRALAPVGVATAGAAPRPASPRGPVVAQPTLPGAGSHPTLAATPSRDVATIAAKSPAGYVPPSARASRPPDPTLVALALAGMMRFGPAREVPDATPATTSRWSGSVWLIARPEGRAVPFARQLGGSQGGLRIAYALGEDRRVAIVGRVAGALGVRQQEAAIGVEWQPADAPVRLFAEQRIGVAGIRGGPAAGVIAGLPPTAVAAGFRLEAYGQAGVILRDGRELFGDGAARLTRPIATVGGSAIDLGLGAWGGAQRGAARLDAGPSAAITLPLAGRRIRVAVDWRQRVAGSARPASGPALSIGSDF